jgi:hypothetical protein
MNSFSVLIKDILQSQDYDVLVAWIDPVYFSLGLFLLDTSCLCMIQNYILDF